VTDPTSSPSARLIHRELLLLVLLGAVAVAVFFGTRAFAVSNAAMKEHDAAVWYATARGALESGNSSAAIGALRRATRLDPRNREMSLALAGALAADRQDGAARQLLVNLRDSQPEDPEVNLQLARLEARTDDTQQAVRYYHAAADGLWRAEQAAARRSIRRELIALLLDHGDRSRALSETLLLAADRPSNDPAAPLEEGQLLLKAGDPDRALDRFAEVLRTDPDNADARAGAGLAAFQRGDYQAASRYFARSRDLPADAEEARTLTTLVLTTDPLAARLSRIERESRLRALFARAGERLAACPQVSFDRSEFDAFEHALSSPVPLSRDDVEHGTELAGQVMAAVDRMCRSDAAPDRAIPLIVRLHGFGDHS
jgi:predicted Zn-dependent protease